MFRRARRFFIRCYFKSRLTLERGVCGTSPEPFKRLYGLQDAAREVYLSRKREKKRERKEMGGQGKKGVRAELAGRYGTVVILKTIIRASGGRAPGIPGAYRDRYLDRVTINTDSLEGGPGHYQRTAWRSHLYLLTLPPPFPFPLLPNLSSSSRRSAIRRK